MIGPLKDLLGHQAWADAVFFRAWEGAGHLEDADLRSRTDHLVTVQGAFLRVLAGEAASIAEGPLPDFRALKARCRANHVAFLALGRDLDEAAAGRRVRVPWFPDPPCIVTVAETLLQVCLHSQHHRGQNMARLRALGGTPKNVDHIIWLWKQKPEGRWEA